LNLYANQDAAALIVGARKMLNRVGEMLPATQIKIAHTKIGAIGLVQTIAQSGLQMILFGQIIKDAWHTLFSFNNQEEPISGKLSHQHTYLSI
jgi:hypothetical protein